MRQNGLAPENIITTALRRSIAKMPKQLNKVSVEIVLSDCDIKASLYRETILKKFKAKLAIN